MRNETSSHSSKCILVRAGFRLIGTTDRGTFVQCIRHLQLHIATQVNIMYRIRLYLAAAAFLVTAVSGNLTSMTFGRRRGILSLPCIVGLSRASHRGRRQMKIGPSIALDGPTIIRTHYPPSSDGSSSLATAVSLRGGGIDANSSSFQLGYQLGYQLGRYLTKDAHFFLGILRRPAHQKQADANRPQISVPPSA